MEADRLEAFDSVGGCTCVSGGWRGGCCWAAIFRCIISGRITRSRWINAEPALITLRSRPASTFRSASLFFFTKLNRQFKFQIFKHFICARTDRHFQLISGFYPKLALQFLEIHAGFSLSLSVCLILSRPAGIHTTAGQL